MGPRSERAAAVVPGEDEPSHDRSRLSIPPGTEDPPPREARHAAARRLRWASLSLVLLFTPALAAPFHSDDVSQLAYLDGAPTGITARSPLDLYRFFDGDAAAARARMSTGLLPWWFDPTERVAFFRPLSSASLWLDHTLFGESALPAHVHSLLWFAALAVLAAILFGDLLPAPAAALAIALFLLQPTAARALTWWCARHVLVSALFGVASLLAFVRWRAGRLRQGLTLSIAGFGLCLLGGESGAGMLPYIVAYALEERARTRRSWSSALAPLLPFLALLAAYLVLRHRLGYGVERNGFYVDPLVDPGLVVRTIASHWSDLASQVALSSTDLIGSPFGARQGEPGAIGLVITGLFLASVASIWTFDAALRPRIGWLLWGSLGAALPCFCSTAVRPWSLILPRLGLSAVLALVAVAAWRQLRTDRRPLARAGGALAIALAAANVCVGLYAVPARCWEEVQRADGQRATLLSLPDPGPATRVFGLRTDRYVSLYKARLYRPDLHLHALSSLSDVGARRVLRVARDTIEITAASGSLLRNDFFRSPRRPFRAGDTVDLDGLRVDVLEATPTAVLRARFRLDRPFDDPDVMIVAEDGAGKLTRVELPAPGEELVLP